MLDKIAPGQSSELMLGFETSDDAAVYRLSDDQAALLTVDFFTPIVDDPYDFGRITAANALSDVYAMGGRPLAVMNLLAFPCDLGPDVVGEVVRGGSDKVIEAGAVTVGGHTIDDKEPKFGLAVFGMVHPDGVVRNRGAQVGDVLVLTKPIGTGLMATALKRGLEDESSVSDVIESMAALNRAAAEAMVLVGVNAGTDITGFGLLGHAHEMALASGCAVGLDLGAVPVFERAVDYAAQGVAPGRTAEIIAWADEFVRWESAEDRAVWMRVLCDPQTSGGLLMSVPADKAARLVAECEANGTSAWVVGECRAGTPGEVTVG